jgi:hypothetical protein
MSTHQLFRYAGWSAYLHAVANIAGLVSLMLFFSAGQPFGTIDDCASVCFALLLIPLALTLHLLHRSLFPPLSLVVATIGILAMITAALLQVLLVAGVVHFEQTLGAVLAANGIIGVWVMSNGMLARAGSTLPGGLAWVSIVAGIGLVPVIVGFWLGGQQHPLSTAGGLVASIGLLIWAIWFGRLLLSGRVTPPR